jgi:Carboxypeptidase regulatory-like domain/TonB-dependent Receptor Plug Domain/TonB dependent receptor
MRRITSFLLLALCVSMGAAVALASTTGSITGIVTDASGAVVPGATITATNIDTGVVATVKTDGAGFYNFPDLLVGNYTLSVEEKGFKSYAKTGIRIDANTVFRVDVKLELGEVSEKVEVQSDAVQVETQSTQGGEVIESHKIEAVPLPTRSFIDLLSLQPGVVPGQYSGQSSEMNDRQVSGNLNPGNQSINGGREASNGFMINGANVNEGKNNGTAAIPNLDSIEEFRIITNNFDAEYGNYSGGQVNVITKSGTNGFHGDLFEFNRNTAFSATNFYAQTPPKYIQNLFGGTFGGPIKKDKLFFFVDYQGSRFIEGETQNETLPDGTLDGAGNYDLAADQLSALDGAYQSYQAGNSGNGVVQGDNWANVLSARLGYPVQGQEPYYFAGCNSTNPATGCVFANGVIPYAAFSSAALGLLKYIPAPNVNNPALGFNYSNSQNNDHISDDKGGIRVDYNTSSWGQISGYYHIDDSSASYAYGGSSVPGFAALNLVRGQVAMVSDTKSFGSTSVNEFRFSYLRLANQLGIPQGGIGVTLESLGFPGGFNPNGGIGPIAPMYEGVPNVGFNNFSIGVPADTTRQYNNTFQVADNFTKIIGTHSLKFGGQFHYDQINDRNYYGENGQFGFYGGESGLDFADFAIGAPDFLIQASQQILDSRTKYAGVYAQDSWRVTPNLTLNYGLRWDMIMPWYDTQNKIETLIPGEQSLTFPGAPTGWVVPGDPHVPSTLAPTQYHNFSPRLGIAYSPSWDEGFLAKLTGGPGHTSFRAGFGMFYTSVEDLSQFQEIGDPPYGLFYVSPAPPIFETPYIDRGTGNNEGQRFPFVFPPTGASPEHPDTTFNWAGVLPIAGALAYRHTNVTPYSEDYEASLQREFGRNAVLSVNYVGTQGHKLITEQEANPGNQQLCLQINQLGGNSAGSGCGPYGEGAQYTLPAGVNYPSAATPNVQLVPASTCGTAGPNQCVVNTTYTVLGPDFGNNPFESTIAQSSYNSLQVSLKQNTTYGNYLLGYTYSRCIDNASGLEEGVNPFDAKDSLSLCAFNVTNNFVASYEVKLPFDKAFHTTSRWGNIAAKGWTVAGITTFATGLPVSISENDDNSLTGTQNTEAPYDLPNFAGGPIYTHNNPRTNPQWFNTSNFSFETLGTFGTSPRRFFSGPGLNNWDLAIIKDTNITESKSLQLRFETFNTWNHAQFLGPDGSINSGQFGVISGARDPRRLQLGAKFIF